MNATTVCLTCALKIVVQVIKRSSQKTQTRRSSLKVCLVPLHTCCINHAA